MMTDIGTVHNKARVLLEERFLLRFNLFGAEHEPPRDDLGPLQVMVYEPAAGLRRHTWAQPMQDGLYEVTVPAPRSGPSYLFFACPKAGIGYAELPHFILQTSVEGIALLRKPPGAGPADRVREGPGA